MSANYIINHAFVRPVCLKKLTNAMSNNPAYFMSSKFSAKIFKSIHLYLGKWLSSRIVNVYYNTKTSKICLLL